MNRNTLIQRSCLAVLLLACVPKVPGETTEKKAPSFQAIRANDDQATREQALYYTTLWRTNVSDFSVGGQVRVRGEYWNNYLFGPDNDDSFLQTRLRLHGDLHACPYFRAYVEGISALTHDRDLPPAGGKRPSDEDELDLLNAFADITAHIGDLKSTLRAGRQEMAYSRQRVIGNSDWSNTRRTFDGVRLLNTFNHWQVDAFVTRLVQVQKYEFNDGDSGQDFYGVYATRALPEHGAAVDLYWLGLDKDSAKFGTVTGDEQRDTLGGRVVGTVAEKAWDYDLEGAYQYGDFAKDDVSAYFVAAEIGYNVEEATEKYRVFAGFDYASGDDDPNDGDLNTYNRLFTTGHSFFGIIDAVARQNIVDYSVGVKGETSRKLQSRIEGHYFQRAETKDALYDASGNVVFPGDAGSSRDVGQEVDVILSYPVSASLLTAVGYGHFFAGNFVDEAGGEDIDFAYAQVQLTL